MTFAQPADERKNRDPSESLLTRKQKPEFEGKRRKLYEENLVHNIMLATSYCIKDLMEDNPRLSDEDIYDFIGDNYRGIIDDTLDDFLRQKKEAESHGEETEPPADDLPAN